VSRRDTLITVGLIAPRILRLLWPRVFFLDAPYLDAAARVAGGERPYRDFVHPQTPLPEWLAGGIERMLGTTSYRVSEILTALLILAASFLLWRLATRRFGATAGALAALLFAWNPLLMLLHVHCREAWVDVAALGCALAGSPVAVLAIAAAGFLAKPTFAFFALALAIARPRLGIFALAGCVLAFGGCLAFYGRPFWIQTVLFHTLKGHASIPRQLLQALLILPLLLPAALLGFRRDRLFAAWLAVPLIFYIAISPTLWEHNLIELLPPACALAAAMLTGLSRRLQIAAAAAVVAGFIAGPLLQGPKGWTGLAGVPRSDVVRAADQLRTLAPPGAPVIAPIEIAAQANRRTPIHYPEIEGLVRMADRADREKRFGALLRDTRGRSFLELHQRAQSEWHPDVERALPAVPAAIVDPTQTDSPLRALQTLGLSVDDLTHRGFHTVAQFGPYTILTR
jgi:hypothetical protein